jgi:hypothetical protein
MVDGALGKLLTIAPIAARGDEAGAAGLRLTD